MTPFAAHILADYDTPERGRILRNQRCKARGAQLRPAASRTPDVRSKGMTAMVGRPSGYLPGWPAIHYASVNPLTGFP